MNKFKFDDGPTEKWPFVNVPKLRLGMWIFLSSDIIVFGAIIATDLYLRVNSPVAWPLPGSIHDITLGLILTIILLTSGLTAVLGLQAAKEGNNSALIRYLSITFILGASFMVIKAGEWYGYLTGGSFTPWGGTLPESTYFLTVGLHGAHVTAGLVVRLSNQQGQEGRVSKTNFTESRTSQCTGPSST